MAKMPHAKILHFEVTGLNDDVKDLQRRLNLLNPTRLPRLAPDGHYGVRTMARVMEFQFRNRLKVDGVVGPDTLSILTHLMLAKPETVSALGPLHPGGPDPQQADRVPGRDCQATSHPDPRRFGGRPVNPWRVSDDRPAAAAPHELPVPGSTR